MHKIIIAIDGYSSCGKSTLSKQLSKALGYRFIDSGAMYRAVTLFCLNNQVDIYNMDAVDEALKNIRIEFVLNRQTLIQETTLNGENIEKEIRTNHELSFKVSEVSSIASVRKFLVEQQRQMGSEKGIVMDGRDIGTVVFPHAELKIFITASPEVRAQRRHDELTGQGENVQFGQVLENLRMRDHADSTREESPLKQAEDAVYLDNTHMTREEQFQFALKLSKERMGTTAS